MNRWDFREIPLRQFGSPLYEFVSIHKMLGSSKVNWKRIAAFVAIIWAATASVGFVIGIINGLSAPSSAEKLVQWLVVLASMALVFAVLAGRQTTQTWEHAWAVAFISWLSSFPLNVLLIGQSTRDWVAGGIAVYVAAYAGVPCGRFFRITSRSDPPVR
jgi:hypothetical protein